MLVGASTLTYASLSNNNVKAQYIPYEKECPLSMFHLLVHTNLIYRCTITTNLMVKIWKKNPKYRILFTLIKTRLFKKFPKKLVEKTAKFVRKYHW